VWVAGLVLHHGFEKEKKYESQDDRKQKLSHSERGWLGFLLFHDFPQTCSANLTGSITRFLFELCIAVKNHLSKSTRSTHPRLSRVNRPNKTRVMCRSFAAVRYLVSRR